MKIGTISILLSLFLIGCGGKTQQNISTIDASEIEAEKVDIQKHSTKKSEEKQKKISKENGEEIKQEQYFYLEACEEMVELKLNILEESYKQGEISKIEYRRQKQQLEQEENQYQLEREALGYQGNLFEPHIQDSDSKAMKKRLVELEEEEEELDRKMEKTKQDYIEQKLSQEDFILKRSKQEEEEERLEEEEDWLERNLNYQE